VSTRQQSTDRQEADPISAGIRPDDLCVDYGVSGGRASRPQFGRPLEALEKGDTLVIATLDRLGRSTRNMFAFAFADELRDRRAALRGLNLGEGDVDTSPPMGSMLFRIMAALAQMGHGIKRERIVESISNRRAAGTDSQVRSVVRLVDGGEPAAQVARELGMSRATFYRRSRALKFVPLDEDQ
jgi:DNA invertase Pin-like site-specific DNA recombinase